MLTIDRFGFDVKRRPLEEALPWAAQHGFRYLEFSPDLGANALDTWSDARVAAIRRLAADLRLHLGIHPSSAVNNAETSPIVRDAVDDYLKAIVDLAAKMACRWVVVHGGYHFSSDRADRLAISIARTYRVVQWATAAGVELWLENHNREPDDAEIHYLPHDVAECREFFDAISSPTLRWSFNVVHAHLVPEKVGGFLEALGPARLAQVRIADNRGDKEEHLVPGEGTIDFRDLFRRLAAVGFTGPLALEFGTEQDKVVARDRFLADYGAARRSPFSQSRGPLW